MSKQLYFNFPVELLKGFFGNKKECLKDALYFSIYSHSLKLDADTPYKRFLCSEKYFGVKLADREDAFRQGELLYDSFASNTPKTGIERNMFWDFYENEKADIENASLLAFLALKSIIGVKPYTKATNLYLWARMDGKNSTISDVNELSDELKGFANRYKTDLIKVELQNNWGLKMYSRYTRGFYVSFTMDLTDLIFQAEKKRKSRKEKELKQKRNDAYKIAMEKLNKEEFNRG